MIPQALTTACTWPSSLFIIPRCGISIALIDGPLVWIPCHSGYYRSTMQNPRLDLGFRREELTQREIIGACSHMSIADARPDGRSYSSALLDRDCNSA